MALREEKLGEVLWPELAGFGTVIGMQVAGAGIDRYMKDRGIYELPFAQFAATGTALTWGGLWTMAGKAPDYSLGLFWGGLITILYNTVRGLAELVMREETITHLPDAMALVPRRVKARSLPGGTHSLPSGPGAYKIKGGQLVKNASEHQKTTEGTIAEI